MTTLLSLLPLIPVLGLLASGRASALVAGQPQPGLHHEIERLEEADVVGDGRIVNDITHVGEDGRRRHIRLRQRI